MRLSVKAWLLLIATIVFVVCTFFVWATFLPLFVGHKKLPAAEGGRRTV